MNEFFISEFGLTVLLGIAVFASVQKDTCRRALFRYYFCVAMILLCFL